MSVLKPLWRKDSGPGERVERREAAGGGGERAGGGGGRVLSPSSVKRDKLTSTGEALFNR